MSEKIKSPAPIYASNGEARLLLAEPYIYNMLGEWVGWVTPNHDVFSILGIYVGRLTREPRILRKRSVDSTHSRMPVPPAPEPVYAPSTMPLAPMMSELTYDTVDVLMECPEELHPADSGEMREDLDY